ncbi:uncharacterized protein NPIL_586621 [Nephila pilipes]|uniref:Uncharacterized protein n=1 Tax=Nephila pilipes TaxID=299642 RepID=A0A8X6M7K8_NEPPI|nr:uncharacterized protein NPIL_586621 [Nephila pilipes]
MLRSSTDGQISSEQNNNVCYVNTSVALNLSCEENTIDTNQTGAGYFAAFQPNPAEIELHSTTWNQTEPVRPMETLSNTSQTSGTVYGVIKRRQKVAKGVQTEEVRKRCWRHRRGPLADKSRQGDNEETLDSRQDSKDDISSPNSSSKSVLRRALPNVNFSTWTRTSKKASGVSLLVESYLGGVYAPFSSIRRQLTEQALARCRDVGREHFEAHILSPTASMLRAVREHVSISHMLYLLFCAVF